MTRPRRTKSVVAVMVVAAVAAMASVAWACTNQARSLALSGLAGPRGSEVTVSGTGLARTGAMEIRWNAVDGPVLATAVADDTGTFSQTVKIPAADPGVYFLVAEADGAGVARSAFELTADTAGPAIANLPRSGFDGGEQLSSSARHPSPAPQTNSFGLGTAVLAVGAAGLLAGSGVVAARRRRVTVGR